MSKDIFFSYLFPCCMLATPQLRCTGFSTREQLTCSKEINKKKICLWTYTIKFIIMKKLFGDRISLSVPFILFIPSNPQPDAERILKHDKASNCAMRGSHYQRQVCGSPLKTLKTKTCSYERLQRSAHFGERQQQSRPCRDDASRVELETN